MPSRKIKCHACNSLMALKPYTHIEQVGPVEVSDPTRYAYTCAGCGETLVSNTKLMGYELRAAAAVYRDGTNVTLETLCYARKALGLTEAQWQELTSLLTPPNTPINVRSCQLMLAAVLDGVASGQFLIQDYLSKWRQDFTCLKKATGIQLRKNPIWEEFLLK